MQNHTGKNAFRFSLSILAAAILATTSVTAFAADVAAGTGPGLSVGANSSTAKANQIAIGSGAAATMYSSSNNDDSSIAIGKNATTSSEGGTKAIAVSFDFSGGSGGIAIGENSSAINGSTVIGQHDYTGALGDVNINGTGTGNTYGDLQYAVGATSVGYNTYTAGQFATSVGAYNVNSTNYFLANTNTINGKSTVSQGFGATILGSLNSNESRNSQSVVSGMANSIVGVANRVSNASGALVFGAGNQITNSLQNDDTLSGVLPTSKWDLLSMPWNASDFAAKLRELVKNSDGGGSTLAIGGANTADWTLETALLGVGNTVTGSAENPSAFNLITGFANTADEITHVTVIGSGNTVSTGTSDIVIGDNHTLTSTTGAVVLGSATETTEISDADNFVSIGTDSNASATDTIALGTSSSATTADAVAIGKSSNATAQDSVAIGTSASATAQDSYAIGTSAVASGKSGLAIGNTASAQGDGSNAIGYQVISKGPFSSAFGFQSLANASDSLAVGYISKAYGVDSLAIGSQNTALASQSVALGYKAVAGALGADNKIAGLSSVSIGSYTKTKGSYSVAIGYNTTASTIGDIALGNTATASGGGTVALGTQAQTNGLYAVAIGTNSAANSPSSVALGTNSTASVSGSVAIGAGSVANRAAGVAGYAPSTKTTSTKVDDSTWTSTAAAVAVGDADEGVTRQITGVAAGSEDTDAVNVAQLRAATLTAINTSANTTTVTTDDPNLSVKSETVKLPITSEGEDPTPVAEASGKDYSVTLSQDLTNMHSATFSNPDVSSTTTVINTNGVTITGGTSGTVSLTSTGLNNGGNKITNVAPGTISATSSDAVNGAQLHETNVNVQKNATNIAANRTDIDNLMNKYNIGQQDLKDRINRAGATAAALAGLHPQDYDEDHKVSGSLGLGFYHGTQALAVGLFVRPTENLMFNIGGAFASNDHMLNLGVSYRFGDNSMEKKSPQQLQEEVTSLKTENTDLSARLATANARIDSQASELKALKAQIADIQKHLH